MASPAHRAPPHDPGRGRQVAGLGVASTEERTAVEVSERRRPAGYDELTTPSRTTEQNSHSEDDGTITALYGGEGTLNGTYGARPESFRCPVQKRGVIIGRSISAGVGVSV